MNELIIIKPNALLARPRSSIRCWSIRYEGRSSNIAERSWINVWRACLNHMSALIKCRIGHQSVIPGSLINCRASSMRPTISRYHMSVGKYPLHKHTPLYAQLTCFILYFWCTPNWDSGQFSLISILLFFFVTDTNYQITKEIHNVTIVRLFRAM